MSKSEVVHGESREVSLASKCPRQLIGQPATPGRWRRRAGVVVLALTVGIGGLVYYLTRPARVASFAQTMIEDATGARVRIARASIDWAGTIDLHQVSVSLPDDHTPAGELFFAARVQVEQDLTSLLTGRFRATTVTLIRPTLHVSKDQDRNRYNFERLPIRDRPRPSAPPSLPAMFIRDGALHLSHTLQDGQTRDIGTAYLSGSLQPTAGLAGAYNLQLRENRPHGEDGIVLTGHYDPVTGYARGLMRNFQFEGVLREALPDAVLEVWDELDPQGSIPLLRFEYDPPRGLISEVELRDMALRLARGEVDERLEHTSGRLTFADQRLTIDKLTGELRGARLSLDGWIESPSLRTEHVLRQASYDLRMAVRELTLPVDPQPYLDLLHPAVGRQYNNFQPQGVVNAQLHMQRAPDATPRFEGHVDVLGISMKYARFAYPVHDIHGRLGFSPERVTIENMRGIGPTGARMIGDGIVEPPADGARVDLHIAATDLPADEHLMAALSPSQRASLEDLFDHEAHTRLLDQGRVQTQASYDAASLELQDLEARHAHVRLAEDAPAAIRMRELHHQVSIPVFELGGKGEAKVHVHRPLGKDSRYHTTVDIVPHGVNVLYTRWGYPARLTGGSIRVDSGIHVSDARFLGLSGGEIIANGLLDNPESLAVGDELLTLTAEALPLDRWLTDTLNDAGRQWLTALRLGPAITLHAVTFIDDDQKVDFIIDTTIVDGEADPWGAGFAIHAVTGKATLHGDTFTLHELTGRRGEGSVGLEGTVGWRGERVTADLDIHGRDVHLDDAMLALIEAIDPAGHQARTLRDRYDVTTRFDFAASYTTDEQGNQSRDLNVAPNELALTWRDQPMRLTEMTGSARLAGPALRLEKLGGTLTAVDEDPDNPATATAVQLDGQVMWLPDPSADVTFTLASDAIAKPLRTLMPRAALRAVDGLSLATALEMSGTVTYRAPQGDDASAPRWTFDSTTQLHRAHATLGVAVSQLEGVLGIRAASVEGRDMPTLNLTLDASRLNIAERQVTNLRVAMATDAYGRVLSMETLTGDVYGGRLVGKGTMDLGGDQRLRLDLSLNDVAFSPFARGETPRPGADEEAASGGGHLSASLTFETVAGTTASQRGRGSLQIREGRLYDVPLANAMLQIANLSLPLSRAFEQVDASYIIEGDIVTVEAIQLRAPSLALVGTGHLRLSDQRLDLAFVSRNPDALLDLGPLSDLFAGLKDELMTIHVTGRLQDPRVSLQSFRRVRDSWRTIFATPDGEPLSTTGELR